MIDDVLPDEELILRGRNGDAEAIGCLLLRYGPKIQKQLRIGRKWRSRIESDDVMQITYDEVFRHFHHFDPRRGSFKTWLERIAQNNLKDAVRGLSGPTRSPVDAQVINPYTSLMIQLGAGSTRPDSAPSASESERLLSQAMAQLPPEYALAIQLYDLEGLDVEQVADRLQCKPGTVHMRRARARERLKALLGDSQRFFSKSCESQSESRA